MAGRPLSSADVTDTSAGYRQRLPQWRQIRDTLEGEERVKERGTVHLPKPRGMKKTDWTNYVQRASFYGVTDRTLRGLTGLVFRVAPTIDLPDALEPLRESATLEGFTLKQAMREGVRENVSLGRYGILVDMAQEPSTTGLPYLATYKAEDIFRWEEKTSGGKRRLTRVVVREEMETHEELTTTILREMVIVEGVYVQRVYREVEGERNTKTSQVFGRSQDLDFIAGRFELDVEFVPRIRGKVLTEIPWWFVNPYDMRPRADKSPFLDLANMNIAHYRNSADYEHALFLVASPTPWIFGVPAKDKPAGIGPGTLWHSENKETTAGFLEFKGTGIGAIRTAMVDKEERMAALGARLIKDVERPNVTAETTRLQSRAETSVLVSAVDTTGEAFEQALKFAATWAGADPDDVGVAMNRDFVETRLASPELQALVAGWQAGAWSRQTLHEQLQAGEIIPASRSLDEEVELIEGEADEMRTPPGTDPNAPPAPADAVGRQASSGSPPTAEA